MIASSPASNLLSRTIPLNPSWAGGGPQKSSVTTDELVLPCRRAIVTGYSARLVLSVTGPLDAIAITHLTCRPGPDRLSARCGRRSTPDRSTSPRQEPRAPLPGAAKATLARRGGGRH